MLVLVCHCLNAERKDLFILTLCDFVRPKWEVCHCEGEDETRLETLLLACEFGANYIEMEFKVSF